MNINKKWYNVYLTILYNNVRLIIYILFSVQIHLALYSFANGQVSVSLRLLYRARYLALLVCGEDHPEVALLDVSLKMTGIFTSMRIYNFYKFPKN